MLCPFCGFQRGEVDEEELQEHRRRKLRDQVYHLKMGSYAVLTLFVVAFAWYWVNTGGFTRPSSSGPYALLAIAALAYLAVRGFLYKARAALKKLNMR